jgi:hypothetical protein
MISQRVPASWEPGFLVVYEAPVAEVLPVPEAAKWRSFSQQVFALALYHTNPGMSKKEQRAGLSNKVLQSKYYLDNHSIMMYNPTTR